MSITVSSSAATTKLTTLDRVKRDLNTTAIADDKLLDDLIQHASDYIVSYTGRKFAKETVVEKLPASGGAHMLLSRTPVVSITGVSHDGTTISSTSYVLEDEKAGLIFRETGWADTAIYVSEITRRPSRFGRKDWQFTYIGGYDLPGSTSGQTLPGDLERACIELVKNWYLNRDKDQNLQVQRIGDTSETRFTFSKGIPITITGILDRYARVDIK